MTSIAQTAYYYPEPYWHHRQMEYIKTLLLFFDDIAILRPRYMRGVERAADPVLAGPLQDLDLLRVLEPETFLDLQTTEALAEIVTELVVGGAFDDLGEAPHFAELSRSRMGWNADVELSDMLVEELQARDLARPSEDGVSIPLHPKVRTTILVLLALLADSAGRRHGLRLHPVTDRLDSAQAVIDTLKLWPSPSTGHVIASDLSVVAPDLSGVSLDRLLEFRTDEGESYREYSRNLRTFVRDLGSMSAEGREEAILDRREELNDLARRLERKARRSLTRTISTFVLGIAGSVWATASGNILGAGVEFGRMLTDLMDDSSMLGAYSYMFRVQRLLT